MPQIPLIPCLAHGQHHHSTCQQRCDAMACSHTMLMQQGTVWGCGGHAYGVIGIMYTSCKRDQRYSFGPTAALPFPVAPEPSLLLDCCWRPLAARLPCSHAAWFAKVARALAAALAAPQAAVSQEQALLLQVALPFNRRDFNAINQLLLREDAHINDQLHH